MDSYEYDENLEAELAFPSVDGLSTDKSRLRALTQLIKPQYNFGFFFLTFLLLLSFSSFLFLPSLFFVFLQKIDYQCKSTNTTFVSFFFWLFFFLFFFLCVSCLLCSCFPSYFLFLLFFFFSFFLFSFFSFFFCLLFFFLFFRSLFFFSFLTQEFLVFVFDFHFSFKFERNKKIIEASKYYWKSILFMFKYVSI